MTVEQFCEKFEELSARGRLKFDQIQPERKRHRCRDINAFLLLDSLISDDLKGKEGDIVSSASHDKIWLRIAPADICERATEEDIRDLIRCGVFLDSEAFSMFA